MNHSCLSVCCTIMRLLVNLSHVSCNFSLSLQDYAVSVSMICNQYILDTGQFSPTDIFASTNGLTTFLIRPSKDVIDERKCETLEIA